MFKVTFHKDSDTIEEEFISAISCAKTCIESVLYDDNPIAIISGNIISVKVSDSNITIQQFKEKVRGCFCDSFGNIYPEFLRINIDQP